MKIYTTKEMKVDKWISAISNPPEYKELVLILREESFCHGAKLVKTFGWRTHTNKYGDNYKTWGKAYGEVKYWQPYPEIP